MTVIVDLSLPLPLVLPLTMTTSAVPLLIMTHLLLIKSSNFHVCCAGVL